jgi:2-keto-4-pentenoate hydratase/2-oxohepta-3-ene-1,7-dioic acid hydratase in catechol pathway
MKLVTFTAARRTRIGIVVDDAVVDLSEVVPELPTDMRAFLNAGANAWAKARDAQHAAGGRLPLAAVRLEAPISNPGKILAIGLNYADHVAESGLETPQHQIWFNKQWNCVAGPGPIEIPAIAPHRVDYEAELCFVIGRRCRHVPKQRAHEVIFGYTCGNDVSVRDWQLRVTQFTLGKSFATHAPIGPWIVTADEFGDPHRKDITCLVNGERRQHSNTRQLIFDCFEQVAELSAAFQLDPGDIVFTGTPGGVGGAMRPPTFLRPGDQVQVQIEGIGSLDNVCVAESLQTLID